MITIASIKAAVGARYGISAEQFIGGRGRKPIAHARQVAMYLAFDLTRRGKRDIGKRYFGGRDHSTVFYAIRQVEARCRADPALDRDLRLLKLDVLAPLAEVPDGFALVAGSLIRADALLLDVFRRGA